MKDVQVAVRFDMQLLAQLDQLVPDPFPSRAEAIRRAVEDLLARRRERTLEEAYVRGYRRTPDDELERWAIASGREMIAEEPW